VTISIGVSSYNGGPVSTAELYKLADKSLYKAKRGGRDRSGPYYASYKTLRQGLPK
jgi:diguanylate cyclase (GGDEF)-like protein